jgi:acyl transferase domain-containing protein/glutamate-1-semialdehyde aminotransferase
MSYSDAYDPDSGVAIIALAGRFPGARDVESFWRNLIEGRETIGRFTDEQLDPSNPSDVAARKEPTYVRARGILEDVEMFDAAFFNVSPREAEVTDPQQRVFLETAWEALERAGYNPEVFPGAIGVFAGMSNNSYYLANLLSRPDVRQLAGEFPMLGNEKDYLATRVSYKLNLRGPSLNIATACSTSLVAVCQAVQSLLTHQCDMALAGGVSISVPQRRGYTFQEGFITSPDGHCRAFDAKAQGTVFSNGLGIVVLKRLEDARVDGDLIYAVIKGAAVNNDGSARVSFTAPSVDGQAEAIAMAQAIAGIDPATISYVEAHGTGTALGDPVEIAGLTKAFRASTDKKGFCAVGSVKTNIGHLDAAAGVTGLIKTALALHHKMLPATLHFQSPNPKLELSETPFFVNAQLRAWPESPGPRRAGLNSLGAGGTNAHVVLEEASERAFEPPNRSEQLLVLSARSADALQVATDRVRRHLEDHPETQLADAAFTLQMGRLRFPHRLALVASDRETAIALLADKDGKRVVSEVRETRGAKVAFLFPGQGAQYVNMGRRLYETEPIVRNEIDSCAELLIPHLNLDLRQILFPSRGCEEEAQNQLTQTAITQPALFVIEHAIARLLETWGVVPVGMIGHSLGDYVAACLAGVFSRDDALVLLAKRARLMQDLPPGSMLAVRAKAEDVQELLRPQVAIAGLNAQSMTVLSGDTDAIRAVEELLTARGVASKYLATSHAFHSAHMDPIVERFASIVATVPRHPPRIPFISSLTGDWIADDQATDPWFWARQLREPVRFADGAARLFDDPSRILVEVGPGQTLATLVRQHPGRKASQVIVTTLGLSSDCSNATSAVLLAAGRLWAAGADLNWPAIHGEARRCRIPLPTYPFERKRYWIEPHHNTDEIPKTSVLQQLQTEECENIMAEANAEARLGPARKGQLIERLQALFAGLSGLETADLNPRTGFLELGLDSLLLTQASAAIQKSFRVKIPFRDLLEDLSTLDALAGRLDAELPPEPAVADEVRSAAKPMADPALAGPGAEPAVAASALERVFVQQLELMSRQLDMLGRRGSQKTSSPEMPRTDAPDVRKPALTNGEAADRPTISFGPYRPPQKSASGGLTAKQDQRLKGFVQRYTQRTPGSKAFTASHRAMLADPRSVAGFRTVWKEMVYPIVASRSAGSKLWDVDGNEYVDLVNGFGAVMFGHNSSFVREAIEQQLERGIEIGPQSTLAGEVAALVTEATGMERVAFCNTGSEAVTAAIRVARTVSGRDLIVSFAGAYHGVFDEVLVRPTHVDGELRSMPIAPGIPSSMTDNIIVLEYGSAAALEILKRRASELAAVLVEPVQSRRPELQPAEFLQQVRSITEAAGVALIFDEIVSGFRAHLRGTQAIFGIRADLATYGKVVGGGLPIGLVTGSSKYMDALDGGHWSYGDESVPEVGVTFFAGTFVRHPLALAAARAVLLHLREAGPELQRNLNLKTTQLVDILNRHAEKVGAPVRVTHFSSWFCFNFPQDVPYASLFYAYMRDKGVHIWEGRAGFLTTAHTEADIDRVVSAFKETIEEMQEAEFLPNGAPEHLPGARLGKDMNGRPAWFVPDPDRPGKYLQVNVRTAADV